jgi:UPF0176 protein
MRRAVLILAALPLLLAGCDLGISEAVPGHASPAVTGGPATGATQAAGVPPAPTASVSASCPYLPNQVVADANGQHVGSVKISAAVSGQKPSCFFYRPDGHEQLSIRVYTGDAATATAIVNAAAPVSTSNPATEPAGWQGGSQSTGSGAVYAVAKGGHAVVVTTNQAQTIKARVVATDAITTLGF